MSARVLLGSSFVFLAAVPVLAGLHGTTNAHATLAEAFASPQPLAMPIRLERTPRMDGVYRAEEWDLLWGQAPSANLPSKPLPPPNQPPIPVLAPPPPVTALIPDAGKILSGPIGPITPPPVTPPTTTDTGHAKSPSSAPFDQNPVTPPKTGGTQTGTAPLTPINIQPIAPPPIVKPTPPPPLPPPVVAPAQSAFMSWEPGKLYFAAFVAPGNDMLVTIDGSNNGFLVGKDNLEIRVTPGVAPRIRARILDATAPSGAVWTDAPGFEMAGVVASSTQPDGSVFVELAVTDPGYGILKTGLKDTVGLRVDGVPTSAPLTDAGMPRVMSQVQLADQRVTNMPEGLGASVAARGRSVVAGDLTTVKWQLTGNEASGVKYVEITGEGAFGDKVYSLRVPSPRFDARGQAVIDYPTRVLANTKTGYAVLNGEVTGVGWIGGSIESSIRVAPMLDIVAPAKKVKVSQKTVRLTCSADIVSNTDERVDGNFQILPPAGWRIIDGTDKNFFIYDKGAKAMREFVLEVPAGTHGTFKTMIRIVALGGIVEQPYWITIL